MFSLGFLPLVFGTEKQVCNLLGKSGWKVLQKNRKKKRYSKSKEKAARHLLVSLHLPFFILILEIINITTTYDCRTALFIADV